MAEGNNLLISYKEFYQGDPAKSESFSRLVSPAHASRIKKLIDETQGKIVLGGQVDVEKRYIAPTVIKDVPIGDVTLDE